MSVNSKGKSNHNLYLHEDFISSYSISQQSYLLGHNSYNKTF